MQYSPLGSTGIEVSRLAFGAGPVPELMTGDDPKQQQQLVEHALAVGIRWFDTAATYGDGRSESNLGAALSALGASSEVDVATKVRFMPEQLDDIAGHARRSVGASLQRLRIEQIALLQIHNSITASPGQEPTSISPREVFQPGGVLEAFQQLQSEGLVRHLGLTAIGQPEPLLEVVRSGCFATIQVPYNLANRSAGQLVSGDSAEANYGNIIGECRRRQMGVFAIRVYAGGALAGQPPSAHTFKTKFFPLNIYRRDQARAELIQSLLPDGMTLQEAALRFVFSHADVTSAIVGFSRPEHIDDAVKYLRSGSLPDELYKQLCQIE